MNAANIAKTVLMGSLPITLVLLGFWWQSNSSVGPRAVWAQTQSNLEQADPSRQVSPSPSRAVAQGQVAQPSSDLPAPQTDTTSRMGLLLAFPFYGSTPSLSWSPDGSHLAFNAAYEYYGYEGQIEANREALGLWVYDRDAGSVRMLLGEQRYHPAWIGNDLIATACSPYEDCTEGLYLTGLDGTNRLALDASVYHTLAANERQVLFYNGFRGYTHWNRFDIHTSVREVELSSNCSWEPPPELFQDQCVQQAGEVRVGADAASGLWMQIGESSRLQIDPTPPYIYSDSSWNCEQPHSGPIAPCLSPDGRQVAYVAQTAEGLELRLHALPGSAEETSSNEYPAERSEPTDGAITRLVGTAENVEGSAEAVVLEEIAARAALLEGAWEAVGADQVSAVGSLAGESEPSEGSGSGPIPPGPTPPQIVELTRQSITAHPAGTTHAFLGFDFYGDTPSLAWSPDGRRLAFNSAYQSSAFMWDEYYVAPPQTSLGLWVIDMDAQTARRLLAEQRYHPVWVGNDTVASACSMWEDCTDGLYITDLDGGNRVALSDSIYNLIAANDHQVLFYSGNEVDSSWHQFDVNTSAREGGLSHNCSWEPPAELAADQCLQQRGDIRVYVQVPTGLYAQVGDAAPVRIDPTPPWIYNDPGVWGCTRESFSGAIEPCLSPDGRHVAYVARGVTGTSLHIVEIPAI